MLADVLRFDDAHHLGEPATRPLSGLRSWLAALLLLAMPRHDSSSRLASQLLNPALGRVQLLFQGLKVCPCHNGTHALRFCHFAQCHQQGFKASGFVYRFQAGGKLFISERGIFTQ